MVTAVLGWGAAILLFFPIFWMVLTSFKTEVAAIAVPPQLFFTPTVQSYIEVQAQADYLHFALNSVVIS
ncbi:MAG: carbohydrate ABC transporter permease, partial [Mycobacteriaceae bacterium]|nr:carbohydrate ABC transporter permease [Mycobacteriaceae bacterium]